MNFSKFLAAYIDVVTSYTSVSKSVIPSSKSWYIDNCFYNVAYYDDTRDNICFYLQPVVKLTFWHVPLNKKWLYLQLKFWWLEALNLRFLLYLDNGFNISHIVENSVQILYLTDYILTYFNLSIDILLY